MHRKHIAAATLIAALIIPAAAYASGEQANSRTFLGSTSINPKTCRFVHREADPATLPSWQNLRNYVLYEDARHDAKMQCLAHHMGQRGPRGLIGKTGARGPAGPAGAPGAGGVAGYTQVSASGTGKTVTATCPSGDVVLGGGSDAETTGSWPSSASSWSVRRDHLSPPTLTVVATCAKSAS